MGVIMHINTFINHNFLSVIHASFNIKCGPLSKFRKFEYKLVKNVLFY